MTSVRKSPNMMSMTGRRPVIAAPTPRPVNPGSEIGVSMMRSVPNSSTRPFTTLNGVPASATSSPSSTIRGSRRISSASASRIASPKLISRSGASAFDGIRPARVAASGIDILTDLVWVGIWRVHGKFDGRVHLRRQLRLDPVERGPIRQPLGDEPVAVERDRIPFRHPALLLLLRPVVLARDVAHVMPAVAVGVEQQEAGTVAAARPIDEPARRRIYGADVLAVHGFRRDAEGRRPPKHVSRGCFRAVRVFAVQVVLAGV